MTQSLSLDMDQMRQSAGDAVSFLRLLSHPDRLLLLCQLTDGEACVSELQARLDIPQPGLSQQLGVLRREQLVTTRREGKHIFYAIADDRILHMLQTLECLFCVPPATVATSASPTLHRTVTR